MKRALAIAIVCAAAGRAAADEPKPEELVGAWKGTATWRACSVAGARQVSVTIAWRAGVYETDLTGARDDLGTVNLLARTDGIAAGTRDDLKVTMKPGRTAKLTLATDAGCVAQMSLARETSGIASCDRLLALASVESTCDAAGDARADRLTAARGKLPEWRKLRGARRTAAAAQCTKDADDLAAQLGQETCLPSGGAFAGGSTGVPECDAYVASLQRYVQCNKVPVEAKQAVSQAVGQMIEGWKMLRDPNVPAEAKRAAADACKQAVEAIRQSAQAMGCSI